MMTTFGEDLHPFFINEINCRNNIAFPRAVKMLLPADDGTILEGVYVKEGAAAVVDW